MDLRDFVHARIAEDAAVAVANSEQAEALAVDLGIRPPGSGLQPLTFLDNSRDSQPLAWALNQDIGLHIQRCIGPRASWTLNMVEALLAEHWETEGHVCNVCHTVESGRPWPVRWPCPSACLAAWPWRRHPDFDAAWLCE